jgi:hypothetical protein
MTLGELTTALETRIDEDRRNRGEITPVVAIGHTKDLVDITTVESFLSFLRSRGVGVSDFARVLDALES